MSSDAKKLKLDDDASGGGSVSSNDNGSSLSDESKSTVVEGENVDKSVYVKDKATGRERWIELSSDGTLDFFSLERVFPGCYGLEYSSTPRVCGVPFNDNNKTFSPPDGGWKGKEFEVIYRVDRSPCRIESPYKVNNVVQNPPPKLKAISPYLFYMLRDDGQRLCVTAVTKYFFVTYRHGSNLKRKLGTTIKIYRHDNEPDSEQFFTATIKLISQKHDFILLKSDKLINDSVPYYCVPPFKGRYICMYGYGNEFNELTCGCGYIHSDELQRFKNKDGEITGPFLLAMVGSNRGDSGASVWCSAGLIGLNLGRIGLETPPDVVTVTPDLVKEAATFTKINYMVTIERIMDAVKEVEAKENPKGLDIGKPMVINIPGVGDFSQVKI
uniref:TAR DNA-binding protein 43 N-terminal domain-containing protein n=1 Tax=Meloidogyne incognita TaxID=6306 RepID=A0A914LHP2_MELIC